MRIIMLSTSVQLFNQYFGICSRLIPVRFSVCWFISENSTCEF